MAKGAAKRDKAKTLRAKKTCCKDRPRCKSCPVVLKRLADAGFAERLDRVTYERTAKPPKSVLAAARAR